MAEPGAQNGGQAGPGQASPTIADDTGIPPALTYLAVAIGLVLVIAGAGMMMFDVRLFNHGSLATCVGFGLVLAAFGTRIAGKWREWSIVGSGATTIALFLLLQTVPQPPPPKVDYVRGNLHGTNDLTSLRMFAAQFLLIGRPTPAEHFRFIAFPDDLESPHFYLQITDDEGDAYIGCIPTDLIKSRMGASGWINFTVQKEHDRKIWQLIDNADGREHGEWGSPRCRAPGTEPRKQLKVSHRPGPARLAAAAPRLLDAVLPGAALAQPAPARIPALLDALESESSEVRASARDQLSLFTDQAAYHAMTATWDVTRSSYRADLGRLVAWVSAIRQNREMAVRVAMALKPDQLAYLVRLTGHGDRTMRYNATEVLSWLLQSTGWPSAPDGGKSDAIVAAVAKAFGGPEDVLVEKAGAKFDYANTTFNTLVAIDDAKCVLKPDARRRLNESLLAFEREYLQKVPSPRTLQASQRVRGVLAKGC
jgi:hypothetical protein